MSGRYLLDTNIVVAAAVAQALRVGDFERPKRATCGLCSTTRGYHSQGQETQITIESLETLSGSLPRRAFALVLEWAVLHRNELRQNWEKARLGVPLDPVEPLE